MVPVACLIGVTGGLMEQATEVAAGAVVGLVNQYFMESEVNVTFADNWDAIGNNVAVYGDGRACCKREIYVMLGKLQKAAIWCDYTEREKIKDFIECDLFGGSNIKVQKGMHGDRLERAFGKHITVLVDSGCRSGDVFHLYGRVDGSAWEVGFINFYDPRKHYRANHRLYRAIPPDPVIVAVGSIPPARPGSPADLDRLSL